MGGRERGRGEERGREGGGERREGRERQRGERDREGRRGRKTEREGGREGERETRTPLGEISREIKPFTSMVKSSGREKGNAGLPNLKCERDSLGYYILLVKAIHILLVVYPTYNDQILESELLTQTTFTAVIGSKSNITTKWPRTLWQCSIRI